mgnify:CR=1 FL=1
MNIEIQQTFMCRDILKLMLHIKKILGQLERKKYYYVFDFLCVLIKKETEQRRTPEMRKRAEMP